MGVLKVLKSKSNNESFKRLQNELDTLNTLNTQTVNFVPKVMNSYIKFGEKSGIIMERINGSTLKNFVNAYGPFSEQIAVEFVIELLQCVDTLHQYIILHRDIHPENILLRDNDISKIILIDFGITFAEDNNACITESAEQCKNSFFFLPQLGAASSNKRDKRSDLTFCIGILFYILSGEYPVALSDCNVAPHLRKDGIAEKIQEYIIAVVDRGFNFNNRWSSAPVIINQLKQPERQLQLTREERIAYLNTNRPGKPNL